MKINKDICPNCGGVLLPVAQVPFMGANVPISEELHIFECPSCEEYFRKKHGEFYPMELAEIVELQHSLVEKTKSLTGRGVVTTIEDKLEFYNFITENLSSELAGLLQENKFHRAYTLDEILEACKTLGINPKTCYGQLTRMVTGWLYSHKGRYAEEGA